jgi:colanic acid/amylovoran biosynthesis glycosyltransferase
VPSRVWDDAEVRVVFVADAFPVVSETFVTGQAAACAAAPGVQVEVVAWPGDGTPVPPGVTVHHRREVPASSIARVATAVRAIAAVGRRSPTRAARFAAAVVRARGSSPLGVAVWGEPLLLIDPPDVVVCHFGWNAQRAALLAPALRPARLAAVFHGADVTSWTGGDGRGRYARVFRELDHLLTVSDRFREQLLAWGADPARTSVHRVGIDVASFETSDVRSDGPTRLLSVARLVEKKGVQVAVRAIRDCPELDVVYEVIGDGPMRAEVEALAASDPRIVLAGSKPPAAVREALGRAHVLLAPSVTASDGDQEGIPVAIMEAMAAGVPVVATRHSGIPELVVDGETGLLVDEHDADGLADAVARLIADPDLRRRLGDGGRRVVAERHDSRRQSQELLEALG